MKTARLPLARIAFAGLLPLCMVAAFACGVHEQPAPAAGVPGDIVKLLDWRSVGPANMGGRITAESELGQGSAFTIHLQVAGEQGLEEIQAQAKKPASAEPGFS